MARPFRLSPVQAPESDILAAVLRYLARHPRVAWAHRVNSGAHLAEGTGRDGKPFRRFVRYGFKGCADILGQLKDGRFLAVECKTRTGRVSEEQAAFLATVREHGGVAVLARSVDDVKEALGC